MRIYYFVSRPTRMTAGIRRIFETLEEAGVDVFSNVEIFNVASLDPQEEERMERTGGMMAEKIGGAIIEGTYPSNEIGYLIAMTLTQKKPVLYLKEGNYPLDTALRYLVRDKRFGPYFIFANYNIETIEPLVVNLIQRVEDHGGREAATIKYTLRITPRLDRYLTWKSRKTKMSKADFLREILARKIMEGDKEYGKYVKK